MLYDIVKQEKTVQPNRTCRMLDIPVTSYKYWINHKKTKTFNQKLLKEIQRIIIEFPGYGYRRVTKSLPEELRVNHKVVRKVMKENGLLCKKRKIFKPQTTDSNHCHPIAPNLVKGLTPKSVNEIWVSDITYISLRKGFVYLAVVMDRFSRKCVGWSLSKNIDSQLTVDALTVALNARQGQCLDGLIHHSDRGSQYASNEYTDLLRRYGILVSMSAKGNPYDNAFAESFIKTIKAEAVYLNEYETFDDALEDIEHFIEEVYNKKRLHSSVGHMPPDEFEQKILKEVGA
ncbi:MAG: IS3 family transposase [Candidatus Micrarchaeota archaeon]